MAGCGASGAAVTLPRAAALEAAGGCDWPTILCNSVREYFLQDCDESTIEQAVARLARQSITSFSPPPREIAWRSTPSSYIVCTKDLATPAETQRGRIRRGVRRVEFDAGHHPFLSRPDRFARLLADEISVATTTTG